MTKIPNRKDLARLQSPVSAVMSTSYAEIADLDPAEKRALLERLIHDKARQPKLFPLSFAQQRLWFLDKLQPNSAAYNVPTVVRLKGRIEVEPLRQALEKVVERHESLRTTFEGGGDASVEWFTQNAEGTKVLVNDVANGGIKAYRSLTGNTALATLTKVSPAINQVGVFPNAPISVPFCL